MPSRINMGPDGGPYIAINENSGNIELEDNTGTTVAIWDDANSQWDFQNNPISNVDSLTSNSVNTEALGLDPSNGRHNIEVYQFIDDDATTTLDLTLSAGGHDLWYVDGAVNPQTGQDSGVLRLQYDGVTSNAYDYRERDETGTIVETNGDTSYKLMELWSRQSFFSLGIATDSDPGIGFPEGFDGAPVFECNTSPSNFSKSHMIGGHFVGNVPNVSSMYLWSDDSVLSGDHPVTGRVTVYGVDLA